MANAGNPFLGLPANILNQIYNNVLTVQNTVTIVPTQNHQQLMAGQTPANPNGTNINQMQFVSQQLHQQTANMGPGHSPNIRFPIRANTTICASQTCIAVLNGMTISQRNALRTIIVCERVPHGARSLARQMFDLQGMLLLAQFAQAHALCRIEIQLQALRWRPGELIALHTKIDLVELVIRKTCNISNNPKPLHVLAACDAARKMGKMDPAYAANGLVFPPNMVFMVLRRFQVFDSMLYRTDWIEWMRPRKIPINANMRAGMRRAWQGF